jgi:hypothetical protein
VVLIAQRTLASEASAAPAGADQGDQLIISISADPCRIGAFRRRIAAYREHHPEAEIVLELKGGTHGIHHSPWLTTQLASGDPRPDIVAGRSVAAPGTHVNFDHYRVAVNPDTQCPWDEDLDFDWFTGYDVRGERTMLAVNSVHIIDLRWPLL